MTKQRKAASGLGRFGDPGFLVLLSLLAGPRHGHGMVVAVHEQFGIDLGPGTLYGSIAKLHERGLIAALPTDDRRQPYELTEAGRAAVAESLAMWSQVVAFGNQGLAAQA